jgi:hypothetical protein
MNNRYNKEVDETLNSVIDRAFKITFDDQFGKAYYATIEYVDNQKKRRQLRVWIENRWYAYASRADGGAWGDILWTDARPSRETMWRLYKLVEANRLPEKPIHERAGL